MECRLARFKNCTQGDISIPSVRTEQPVIFHLTECKFFPRFNAPLCIRPLCRHSGCTLLQSASADTWITRSVRRAWEQFPKAICLQPRFFAVLYRKGFAGVHRAIRRQCKYSLRADILRKVVIDSSRAFAWIRCSAAINNKDRAHRLPLPRVHVTVQSSTNLRPRAFARDLFVRLSSFYTHSTLRILLIIALLSAHRSAPFSQLHLSASGLLFVYILSLPHTFDHSYPPRLLFVLSFGLNCARLFVLLPSRSLCERSTRCRPRFSPSLCCNYFCVLTASLAATLRSALTSSPRSFPCAFFLATLDTLYCFFTWTSLERAFFLVRMTFVSYLSGLEAEISLIGKPLIFVRFVEKVCSSL